MTQMAFYHLKTLGDGRDRDLCIIRDFVEGIENKTWQVQKGVRLAPIYPQDAKIFMDPRHKGIKLSSLLGASGGKLIVHKEFKELIEKHCQGVDIEYLPFTLYDHRKRVASRDYFIINPIGTFDCLDFKASDIKWDEENPEEIISIRKHVLDRKKVENAPQLFRIDKDTTEYVLGGEAGHGDTRPEADQHRLEQAALQRREAVSGVRAGVPVPPRGASLHADVRRATRRSNFSAA